MQPFCTYDDQVPPEFFAQLTSWDGEVFSACFPPANRPVERSNLVLAVCPAVASAMHSACVLQCVMPTKFISKISWKTPPPTPGSTVPALLNLPMIRRLKPEKVPSRKACTYDKLAWNQLPITPFHSLYEMLNPLTLLFTHIHNVYI